MVNRLLETSHPPSSFALHLCGSVADATSILRTHFQVPYPLSPLFATLTKTPGVWGYSSHFGTSSPRLKPVALDVLVGDAPNGAAGSGEEKFFDGDAQNVNSKEMRDVVIALDEFGIQPENDQEQDKIQSGERQHADEHGGDQIGAENGNDQRANRKSDDAVVDGLVRMPEFESEKNRDDDHEWREVPLARCLAKLGEPLLQGDFRDHASDASDGGGPEKIFDAHFDFLVEVKERRRSPILWNKKNAGQRQGRGNERAPANLGAVILSQKVAGQPGSVKDERADEIRIVIIRHGNPPAGEWSECTPSSSRGEERQQKENEDSNPGVRRACKEEQGHLRYSTEEKKSHFMGEIQPELIAQGFIWYVAFLFSTTCHEAAHALAAKLGGDDTAFVGGQVSLNPVPHIQREPWGMVVWPILSLILFHNLFGWASAPYDPLWERRHPRRAAWMALAGPATNYTLMLLAALLLHLGWAFHWLHVGETGRADFATSVLGVFFFLNLLLGTFNLLPVPPLDGSTGIMIFMRESRAQRYLDWLRGNSYAMLGLLVGIIGFRYIFGPIEVFAMDIFLPRELLYPLFRTIFP